MQAVCPRCGTPLGAFRKHGVCQPCYAIEQQEKLNKTQSDLLNSQHRSNSIDAWNKKIQQEEEQRKKSWEWKPPVDSEHKPYVYVPRPKPAPPRSWDSVSYVDTAEILMGLIFGPICIYITICLLAWTGKFLFWMITMGYAFGREFPHWIWYWF